MLRFFISLLLLLPLLINSQTSQWLELPAACEGTPFIVEYITDNSYIIIGIPGVSESYISSDAGNTYQRFPWTSGRFIVEIESSDNDFYFIVGSEIYRYDEPTNSAELIHDNTAYGHLRAGVILQNDEKLLIYSNDANELMAGHFDSGGALLASNFLDDRNLNIELLYQEGHPSYITKSTYGQVKKTIQSLDLNDLSQGPELEVSAHSTGMRYVNGRLFSSNMYSDDGAMSWTEISSPVDVRWGTSMDVYKNVIVIMADDHLLLSTDYGETFTTKSHNLDASSFYEVSIYNEGNSLLIHNSHTYDYLFFSDNLGTSWSAYDNTFDFPNAIKIASTEADQLVTNTISCTQQYHLSNNWNEVTLSDDSHLWDIKGLPNGNYVGLNARDIYISRDNGAYWEVTEPDFYESELRTKEGVVYVTGYSGVAISQNNGEDYTRYDESLLPNLWNKHYDYFDDLKAVYYDTEGQLKTFDFTTSEKATLGKTYDALTHINITTDWSGPGFYLLEYASASQEELVVVRSSSASGSSFDLKAIPFAPVGNDHTIRTDHNGYVIIYNTDQILISQDEGNTWMDITPERNDLWLITDLTISHDSYIYLSTIGSEILKLNCALDNDIIDCVQSELMTDDKETLSLQVFPNPFIDHINLQTEANLNFEVNIYNANGLLMKSEKNMDRIELDAYSAGLYLLEVSDSDSSRKVYKKIVK